MTIKDIKIGIYGDVQITSRTVGESTDYVTADSGMPIQVFHELINTWIKYNKKTGEPMDEKEALKADLDDEAYSRMKENSD